jgi:hypothetical protein
VEPNLTTTDVLYSRDGGVSWNLSKPLSAEEAATACASSTGHRPKPGFPPRCGNGRIPAGMEISGPVIPMSTADGPAPCRQDRLGALEGSGAANGCNYSFFDYPKAQVIPPSGFETPTDHHWANDSKQGTPADPWHTARAAESAMLVPGRYPGGVRGGPVPFESARDLMEGIYRRPPD